MKKSLFGYGLTTKALAKAGDFDIYDDNFKEASIDNYGNRLLNPESFDENLSQLELPSPGFPPQHKLITKAKNLRSEYDYFFDKMPFSIWISGTNGKTTTTKMTGFLLEKHGAEIGGNVGIPLAALNEKAKIWILETSSFTLHYTKKAYPNIYLLLPVSQDHLSWHGSFEEYLAAKLKPLKMMKEDCLALLPELYKDKVESEAKMIFYKDEKSLAEFCELALEDLAFKEPFALDALLALSVEKILFDRANLTLINNFKIEEHKLEEFEDIFRRIWVNDTKATNIDAAIAAINRYQNKKIHLILGGDDKGVAMDELFEVLKDKSVELYLIASNMEKLAKLSEKYGIQAHSCEVLAKAVEEISKNLTKDEIALLSPAAASLDQFSSYIERGEKFKSLVKELN